MADDMYDEEASQTESGDTESSEENADTSEDTALLPKSFFPNKQLEPGKVCKVKVDEVYEDEVMVSYVQHEGDSEDKEEVKEPEMGMDEPDEMYA